MLKFEKIADDLRQQIKNGLYLLRKQLPKEKELCKKKWRARRESNPRFRLRRPASYPLDYEHAFIFRKKL